MRIDEVGRETNGLLKVDYLACNFSAMAGIEDLHAYEAGYEF